MNKNSIKLRRRHINDSFRLVRVDLVLDANEANCLIHRLEQWDLENKREHGNDYGGTDRELIDTLYRVCDYIRNEGRP